MDDFLIWIKLGSFKLGHPNEILCYMDCLNQRHSLDIH